MPPNSRQTGVRASNITKTNKRRNRKYRKVHPPDTLPKLDGLIKTLPPQQPTSISYIDDFFGGYSFEYNQYSP